MRWLIYYGLKWSATTTPPPPAAVLASESWSDFMRLALIARNNAEAKVLTMCGQMQRLLHTIHSAASLPMPPSACQPETVRLERAHGLGDTVVVVFDANALSDASTALEEARRVAFFMHGGQVFTTKPARVRYVLRLEAITQEVLDRLTPHIDQAVMFAFLDIFTTVPHKVEGIRVVSGEGGLSTLLDACATIARKAMSEKLASRFRAVDRFEDALV